MLNKSTKFSAAHAITRLIIQGGDDYRATFGAALRFLDTATRADKDALYSFQRIAQAAAKAGIAAVDAAFDAIDGGRADGASRWATQASKAHAALVALHAAGVAISKANRKSRTRNLIDIRTGAAERGARELGDYLDQLKDELAGA